MKKILAAAAIVVFAAALILLFTQSVPTGEQRADGLYFGKMKTMQMKRVFKAQNYNMLDVLENKKPVPRLFVHSVPVDFNRSKFDDERPALFTEMMLPVIMKANKAVLNERAEIERLQSKFDARTPFLPQEAAWLENTAKKYDIDFDVEDLALSFRTLLLHVDSVPPSLLLAMAAEDSGFATSRYAREYNAVFHARNWDGGCRGRKGFGRRKLAHQHISDALRRRFGADCLAEFGSALFVLLGRPRHLPTGQKRFIRRGHDTGVPLVSRQGL